MKITPSTRRLLQLQNLVFVIALLALVGLLAWLTTRYSYQADWTSSGRNSLSIDSRQLLDQMPEAVHITAFARDTEGLRSHIRDLVGRYQRYKPDIQLQFVNPDADPERVRELGITMDGELLVAYQGRSEKLQSLGEQALTNSLLRITRQEQRRVAFLSGHGERNPLGEANHDFGNFGVFLQQKGIELGTLNLAETARIPGDINLLVIADAATRLLPGEVRLIRGYLDQGGNLLWLVEPGDLVGLEPLAEALGIEVLPGTIVDASTQLFGIDNPAFALIPDYPMHPLTRDISSLTLFPQAAALEVSAPEGWLAEPVLTTLNRSWTEIGPMDGSVRFDEDSDERLGPLDIGFAFTRPQSGRDGDGEEEAGEQRVVVIGDSDFLSNSFLGNGGNIDLGLNLINWLNHDDRLVTITARTVGDSNLELSATDQVIIGFGFLFVLPLLLLGSGLGIWWKRRNR